MDYTNSEGAVLVQKARKTVLPRFVVTVTADISEESAIKVDLLEDAYYVKPDPTLTNNKECERAAYESSGKYNFFPVVLRRNGSPWPEANLWLMTKLEDVTPPDMDTLDGIAADLAHYCEFIEDNPSLSWTDFPAHKLKRPTYRYSGHLRRMALENGLSVTLAKRRMSTVRCFYAWLMTENLFIPAYPAWKEKEVFIVVSGKQGQNIFKKIAVADVSIHAPTQYDPYAEVIDDGGKLRPLPQNEQQWLVEALLNIDNYPMMLIHLFGMLTGARIQTILTFQLGHAIKSDALINGADEVLIPVGDGTGIDTKDGKRQVLHIPSWFYQKIKTYALSEAAALRRCKALGGDHEGQYLFLSKNGSPLYQSKSDKRIYNPQNKIRYSIKGQAVRQFMREQVLPHIRNDHPNFAYQFHDTRATFGMNMTDEKLSQVAKGEITLLQAREYVATRMAHSSTDITDRYLKYRRNMHLARRVNAGYDEHLKALVERVRK